MSLDQEEPLIGNWVMGLAVATGLGIGGGGFLGMLWGMALECQDGPIWGAALGFAFCALTLLYDHFGAPQKRSQNVTNATCPRNEPVRKFVSEA